MTFKIFTEWQPFSIAMRAQWQSNHGAIALYLFLLGLWTLLIVSVAQRPRGGDLPLLVIAFLMSLAALKSVRNVPLAAFSCAIPGARHLGLLLNGRMRPPDTELKIPYWAQWLAAGAVLLVNGAELTSTRLPTDMTYPSSAVNFMKVHRLSGNIMPYFCWGEYLIWHLAPNSRVFLDSRYDMVYPVNVTRDYLELYWGLPSADKVLKKYQHDFVLMPTDEKVYQRMIKASGWKLIYRDRGSALFARTDSGIGQLGGRAVLGAAPAEQYFP
jgi:hypothetical protein